MARRLFVGGLCVSMAAAVVVGASLASASSGSGARVWGAAPSLVHFGKAAGAVAGDTITVISKNATETDVDEPPSGFSQGDEITVSSPLFDTAGSRVGHLDVHGAITALFQRAGVARGQFEFTATLRNGAITATGVATFSESGTDGGFTAAVTGGTGAYRKTDGWVRVTFTSATTSTFAYHLTD
ncbi:MAG TPA: hypothetical protein VE777_04000 [Gaiellales bacterium]|nr:hypothetical protein [Gaiellales bacterium]